MEDELVEMEAAFWRAAGDGDFYRQHFAEDGMCVFGFGVLDKRQTVASIEAAQPWTSFEMQDVATITLGRDVRSPTTPPPRGATTIRTRRRSRACT